MTVAKVPALIGAAELAVDRAPCSVLGDIPELGRDVAAYAAARLSERTDSKLTVFGPATLEADWKRRVQQTDFKGGVAFLSHTRQAVNAHLLDPEHTLLVDTTKMTRDITTTSWKAFAPILRSAPRVIMYVSRMQWPQSLCHVELLGHFDRMVHVDKALLSA